MSFIPSTSPTPLTPETSVKNQEIPVQNSPRTPVTPRSPVDISLDAQKTLRSGTDGGRWTKFQYSSELLYSPPSVEVAKRFLRTAFASQEFKLPPRSSRRVSSDTPVTSGQVLQTPDRDTVVSQEAPVSSQPASPIMQTRVQTCHGCHRVIGDGNHNGSRLGKIACTLKHSELCLGGIPESDNWKGCPVNYVSKYHSYNVTGFSQTLNDYDFQSVQSSTPAGTPGSGSVLNQQQPQIPGLLQPELEYL